MLTHTLLRLPAYSQAFFPDFIDFLCFWLFKLCWSGIVHFPPPSPTIEFLLLPSTESLYHITRLHPHFLTARLLVLVLATAFVSS